MTCANKCAHKLHDCKYELKLYINHGLHHPALPEPPNLLPKSQSQHLHKQFLLLPTSLVSLLSLCQDLHVPGHHVQLGALGVEGGEKATGERKMASA